MSGPTPLQLIAEFMQQSHPGVKYRFGIAGVLIDQEVTTDWGTGVKLTFPGMVVKYKRERTRLKKRDGSWASEQIAAQAATLDELTNRGYIAQFAVGQAEFQQLVDSYLEG